MLQVNSEEDRSRALLVFFYSLSYKGRDSNKQPLFTFIVIWIRPTVEFFLVSQCSSFYQLEFFRERGKDIKK